MYFRLMLAAVLFYSFAMSAFGAVPAPHSLGRFVNQVSKKTGLSPEEVREKIFESIRETGNLTAEDLRRIRAGEEIQFSPARQNELLSLIQDSAAFRVSTGLENIRLKSIQTNLDQAFDRIALGDAETTFRTARNLYNVAELKTELVAMKDRLQSSEQEIAAAALELGHARNSLFYATTTLLRRKGVGFTVEMDGGIPVIRLESSNIEQDLLETVELLSRRVK